MVEMKRMHRESKRTMESDNCNSSSFLLASVLSFLASSARLTESVSLRNLVCNLCSINCLFFAYYVVLVSIRRRKEKETDGLAGVPVFILDLGFVECTEDKTEHAFTAFAFRSCIETF